MLGAASNYLAIPFRFLLLCLELLIVLPLIPRIFSIIGGRAKGWNMFGEFVRMDESTSRNASVQADRLPKSIIWGLRPLQGVGLSMAFAERLLSLSEPSGNLSITQIIGARPDFTLSSILVALLLVVLWTLDDLRIGIFDGKTGEIRLAGTFVGVLFPVLLGALGIYDLLEASSGLESGILSVVGIIMVFYPPYCTLTVFQEWYVGRRREKLSSKFSSFRTVRVEVV